MEIMQVIEARHSVRQYIDKPIESEKRNELDALCKKINSDTGMNIQIIYDDPKCFNTMMARFGKFSGVTNYISVVGKKDESLDEKAGYYGQMIVLKAQELGLNTCWVAMTHGKSKATVAQGEKEAIVISLGYGKTQGSTRKSKPVETLAQMEADAPEWYIDGVKAACLAPTAMNQQKFRIERDGDVAKITAPSGMYTKMDLGIVKYNFEAASGHKTM